MLSNVCSHCLSVLGRSIVKNPLNQVVTVLIARNINERNSGAISTTLADTVKIPA